MRTYILNRAVKLLIDDKQKNHFGIWDSGTEVPGLNFFFLNFDQTSNLDTFFWAFKAVKTFQTDKLSYITTEITEFVRRNESFIQVRCMQEITSTRSTRFHIFYQLGSHYFEISIPEND